MSTRITLASAGLGLVIFAACDPGGPATGNTGPSSFALRASVSLTELPLQVSVPTTGECEIVQLAERPFGDRSVHYKSTTNREIVAIWSSSGDLQDYLDMQGPRFPGDKDVYSVHWSRNVGDGTGGGTAMVGTRYKTRDVGMGMLSTPKLGPVTAVSDFLRRFCHVA